MPSVPRTPVRAPDPRRFPGWLLVCVWGVILAVALLQLSFSEREGEWRLVVMDWAPWLLLSPVVIWLSNRIPIARRTWIWALPSHLVLSLLVTGLLGFWAFQAVMFIREDRLIRGPDDIGPRPFILPLEEKGPPPAAAFENAPAPGRGTGSMRLHPLPPRRPRLIVFAMTRGRGQFFFYWAILAVVHAVHYQRRSEAREREAIAAEARLAEARLTALQAQLQPHFLFNTLHAISGLVYSKPAAADSMICSLSDLLRSVLAVSERREVPLAEELAMVRSYVSIQQIRFEENLEVRWEIADDVGTARVPTLLLQPLVENAVVHAVEGRGDRGRITVRARRAGARLVIEVEDDGAGAGPRENEPARGGGVGLSNTRARLQELYGSDHVFDLNLTTGAGARVRIELPFRPQQP